MLLKLIGFTTAGMPVYAMCGGAPEDGSDDNNNADADGAEEDDSDTEEDDFKPPSKEEWELVQGKLKRANGEAASRRKWLEAAGIDARTGKPYDSDDDETEEERPKPKPKPKASKEDDTDTETTQAVTSEELDKLERLRRAEGKKAAAKEARLSSALVKHAAQNALREAGWNGKGASLIERMIDLGDVEVDDEGNVVGLDEQVADVKSEMPDWFKKARTNGRVRETAGGAREVDGADKTGTTRTAAQPQSWLDKLSAQIDGTE